jgi:putative hydrolase of the HAD superfamily
MKVRAVLFDLGGVVLDAPLQILADFEETHGLPSGFINHIIREGGDQGPWQSFERGEIEPDEFCEGMESIAQELGHPFEVAALLAEMALRMTIRQDVVDTIRKLRNQEYLVAALTNNWALRDALHDRLDALRDEFDYFIESHKVGSRKPEAAIYTLTLDEMGVRARDVVFLDDLGQNLKPARAMGMHTIKVNDPAAAVKELWSALE